MTEQDHIPRDAIKITIRQPGSEMLSADPDAKSSITAEFTQRTLTNYTAVAALQGIVDRLAEEYVKLHGSEILAHIKPEVIANMIMAEAAVLQGQRLGILPAGKKETKYD